MMEQALNVIYFLAEHPETIAENIIKKLASCLLDKSHNHLDTDERSDSQDNENGKNATIVLVGTNLEVYGAFHLAKLFGWKFQSETFVSKGKALF